MGKTVFLLVFLLCIVLVSRLLWRPFLADRFDGMPTSSVFVVVAVAIAALLMLRFWAEGDP